MPRPKKLEPRVIRHPQSGRGEAIWWDANGEKQRKMLPGEFGSEEMNRAFGMLLLEAPVQTRGEALPADSRRVSVAKLMMLFLDHAERRYRKPDGSPTSSLTEFKIVARVVLELYGPSAAAEFSPSKFKACRQKWVNDELARSECNRRANMIRQIVRWGVAEELVPVATLAALEAVAGLERGHTSARETEPVQPVEDDVVDATLPHLGRHVAAMVQVQRHTGMRPGEVCALRACEIDMSADVWLYVPSEHKTAHHGKRRTIPIGPRAQAILKPFLEGIDSESYLFNPAEAVAEIRAARRAARKTPVYTSHAKRYRDKKVKNPKRTPAERYNAHSYGVAISRACDLAFPAPAPLCQRKGETASKWKARLTDEQKRELAEWRSAHRWHPNQLRHTFATSIRKSHGLEAAQVLLGHSRADMTQVYAERNEALGVKIAGEVG